MSHIVKVDRLYSNGQYPMFVVSYSVVRVFNGKTLQNNKHKIEVVANPLLGKGGRKR